jgi:hypothetical protein
VFDGGTSLSNKRHGKLDKGLLSLPLFTPQLIMNHQYLDPDYHYSPVLPHRSGYKYQNSATRSDPVNASSNTGGGFCGVQLHPLPYPSPPSTPELLLECSAGHPHTSGRATTPPPTPPPATPESGGLEQTSKRPRSTSASHELALPFPNISDAIPAPGLSFDSQRLDRAGGGSESSTSDTGGSSNSYSPQPGVQPHHGDMTPEPVDIHTPTAMHPALSSWLKNMDELFLSHSPPTKNCLCHPRGSQAQAQWTGRFVAHGFPETTTAVL